MPIKNTTEYTFDALKQFNLHHIMSSKPRIALHALASVCSILTIVLYCFSHANPDLTPLEPWILVFAIAILVIDVYMILYFTVFLKSVLKKNPVYDSRSEYTFGEDGITEVTTSAKLNASTTTTYELIFKVTENEDYFFIYISKNQAFIVSKLGFENSTPEGLRVLLRSKIDAKKLKKMS